MNSIDWGRYFNLGVATCFVQLPENLKQMSLKCPHCTTTIYFNPQTGVMGGEGRGVWEISWNICPECEKAIIYLSLISNPIERKVIIDQFLAYPRSINRVDLSPEVPAEFAGDYKEACAILLDSPKASAALSRRCLQKLIWEKAGIKERDLAKEIDKLINSGTLPSYLVEGLDAIRNIGNFAAHPIKSNNTGEIVEVEPGEAEWSLDLLEDMFDFYFVQPALHQKKKDALNRKLKDAGKPPMK